jgi:mannose-6-phosphate isomerase-like protein (cupin superfamily)
MSPRNGEGGRLGTPESVVDAASQEARVKSRAPKRVDKPWGFELIWAHTDDYAGKVLRVTTGEALSLQLHEEKDETLYLLEGEVRLLVGTGLQSMQEVLWKVGESIHIPAGTYHRMEAVTECTILEVSTPELDDVVRVRDRYGRAPDADRGPSNE